MGQPLWLSLRPNPVPMLHLRPGTDITMVVGQDITEDTEGTMDGEDTTDTPTDTVTWENALLMPNPKLMPKLPLRLMLIPLPGIMVVTMDTPDTDTTVWDMAVTMVDTTDIVMDTDTVTGDKVLLQIRTPHTMVITGANLSVTIPNHLV